MEEKREVSIMYRERESASTKTAKKEPTKTCCIMYLPELHNLGGVILGQATVVRIVIRVGHCGHHDDIVFVAIVVVVVVRFY